MVETDEIVDLPECGDADPSVFGRWDGVGFTLMGLPDAGDLALSEGGDAVAVDDHHLERLLPIVQWHVGACGGSGDFSSIPWTPFDPGCGEHSARRTTDHDVRRTGLHLDITLRVEELDVRLRYRHRYRLLRFHLIASRVGDAKLQEVLARLQQEPCGTRFPDPGCGQCLPDTAVHTDLKCLNPAVILTAYGCFDHLGFCIVGCSDAGNGQSGLAVITRDRHHDDGFVVEAIEITRRFIGIRDNAEFVLTGSCPPRELDGVFRVSAQVGDADALDFHGFPSLSVVDERHVYRLWGNRTEIA